MTAGRWQPTQFAPYRVKEALLATAIALAGAGFVLSTWAALAAWRNNRVITDLVAGRDLPFDAGSRLEVKIARAQFLLHHDRIDEAQAIAAEIKAAGDTPPGPRLLANLQYNIANARMRAAFDLIERNRIDAAASFIGLAKDGYRAALTSDPEHWDARYNLDVAMRLVRDFSPVEQNPEETSQEPPKRLWTDLPGTPKGLP